MKTDIVDDLAADPALLESIDATREDLGWDVAGSHGHRAASHPNNDEDQEGRAGGVTLVEAGVLAAEYDQMLQAEKRALLEDEVETPTEADEGSNEAYAEVQQDEDEENDGEVEGDKDV